MNFSINLLFLVTMACTTPGSQENDLKEFANIVSVAAKGNENNYIFHVGIRSTETGCDQYADWWEVLSKEGKLIYRRILAHSHTSEQPFVRSGGVVKIGKNQAVFIRAHMNNSGYGGVVFSGTVEEGFEKAELASEFALDVEKVSPQPTGCAF